jgi:hypothetical protein
MTKTRREPTLLRTAIGRLQTPIQTYALVPSKYANEHVESARYGYKQRQNDIYNVIRQFTRSTLPSVAFS